MIISTPCRSRVRQRYGAYVDSLVYSAISLVVIILVALLMGFRSPSDILFWLAVAGILAPFTLVLTWIAAIVGLSANSVDSAGVITRWIHSLPLINSAFVPTRSMPQDVRAFAENQPVTPIVETIRTLLPN